MSYSQSQFDLSHEQLWCGRCINLRSLVSVLPRSSSSPRPQLFEGDEGEKIYICCIHLSTGFPQNPVNKLCVHSGCCREDLVRYYFTHESINLSISSPSSNQQHCLINKAKITFGELFSGRGFYFSARIFFF